MKKLNTPSPLPPSCPCWVPPGRRSDPGHGGLHPNNLLRHHEGGAGELGYELVVLDSQNDPAKELSNVEDLTVRKGQRHPDQPDRLRSRGQRHPSGQQGQHPVLTLTAVRPRVRVKGNHIASDNVGRQAGLATPSPRSWAAAPRRSSSKGIAGTSAARDRGEGFALAVAANKLEVLASQPADFDRTKGLNVMENLLAAHLTVAPCSPRNDEMALGAIPRRYGRRAKR